jgi:hypothetical protein
MSELIKLIQEADVAALEMEQAKMTVETAKLALENAKENLEQARRSFDDILVKADELGIPRPKVKKLIEERTTALVASGLMGSETRTQTAKPARAAKGSRKNPKAVAETDVDTHSDAHSEADVDGVDPFAEEIAADNVLAM